MLVRAEMLTLCSHFLNCLRPAKFQLASSFAPQGRSGRERFPEKLFHFDGNLHTCSLDRPFICLDGTESCSLNILLNYFFMQFEKSTTEYQLTSYRFAFTLLRNPLGHLNGSSKILSSSKKKMDYFPHNITCFSTFLALTTNDQVACR